MFRPFFETPPNTQALAELAPFFLKWPNKDVQSLMSEVTLYAGLHRYATVTDFLADNYRKYSELACALQTKALVDADAVVTPDQASGFVKTFVELLRARSLSRTALYQLAT